MTSNYFSERDAASRYARSRPDITAPVLAFLETIPGGPVDLAADVGCGTGQSARALRAFAKRVVGVDASAWMLAEAAPMDGVEYRLGLAEALPLGDGECGLLTAGMAFHWFDRDRFLPEARRVLATGGHLAVWNAGCAGHGEPGPAAWSWFSTDYLREFPATPRDSRPLDDVVASAFGIRAVLRERFALDVPFDHATFVEFLTTQSNILAVLRDDPSGLPAIRDRLERGTTEFFPGPRTPWRFEGELSVFRREG